MIGLERQKKLLGCADDRSSCVAELAGALGTDGIIVGSPGKPGTNFTISLKIIRARDGCMLFSRADRGDRAAPPGVATRRGSVSRPDGGLFVVIGGGPNFNDGGLEDQIEHWTPANGYVTGGTWTTPARYHTALTLNANQIFVAGGERGDGVTTDGAFLFQISTKSITAVAPMTHARKRAAVALLPSGNILVVGGEEVSGGHAEIYYPGGNFWLPIIEP